MTGFAVRRQALVLHASRIAARRRQSGLAIAAILVIMMVGAMSVALAFVAPPATYEGLDKIAQDSFVQARAALIGRAAMDDNRPGSLPCPDTDNDGIAELLAGTDCPKNLGRLPWRTLGLPRLTDGSGEVLWYALSPTLRDDASVQPINSDTAGVLTISGTMTTSNLAAVLIAPGPALGGQVRNAANENDPAHYLEGENANFETSASHNLAFQMAAPSGTFNDRVEPITHRQLFNAVEWRVANELRVVLQRYYTTNGYFPYANDYASGPTGPFSCKTGELRGRLPNPDSSAISATCTDNADWGTGLSIPPPAWFFANGWHLLTYYALAPACTHATPACSGSGLLTVNGAIDRRAVVIVGGAMIAALGQTRPCLVQSDCIEQPSAATDQYQRKSVTTVFNDKVAVLP